MADLPHIRFPIALDGIGRFQVVEQDSLEDIEQCVTAILRTPLGFSDAVPDLGLTYQPFYEGGADVTEIQEQLAAHEPRVDALVDEDPDRLNDALAVVNVRLSR
jgi:phage baseplate assembly protein W